MLVYTYDNSLNLTSAYQLIEKGSCERDAEQVFKLLESVYQNFDRIANHFEVFKGKIQR